MRVLSVLIDEITDHADNHAPDHGLFSFRISLCRLLDESIVKHSDTKTPTERFTETITELPLHVRVTMNKRECQGIRLCVSTR